MAIVRKTCLEMMQVVAAKVGASNLMTIEDVSTGENRLLLSALNAASNNIVNSYDWSELIRKSQFTADQQTETGYYNEEVGGYELSKIAPGFIGFKNKIIVSTNSNMPYSFGTIDEYLNSKIMPSIFKKFIIKQDCLCFLDPQPSREETFSFHYKTNLVVKSKVGELVEYTNWFRGNNDTWILDDQLLIRGAIVEYKNSRGIDAAYDLQQYQMLLNALRDVNASNAILSEYPQNSDNAFKITAMGNSVPPRGS